MKLPRREVGSRRSGVESRRRYRGPTAQSAWRCATIWAPCRAVVRRSVPKDDQP